MNSSGLRLSPCFTPVSTSKVSDSFPSNLITPSTFSYVDFITRSNFPLIPRFSNVLQIPNIVRVIKSRRLRWAGHVARMEEGRSAFKILTGKPTGKRPLGSSRRRWEDNIRIDLEEIGINAGNFGSGEPL